MSKPQVFIYYRVANRDQLGLETQVKCLQASVQSAGYAEGDIPAECEPGATLRRPALERVTQAAMAGNVDVILAAGTKRLGLDRRMATEYARLIAPYGAKLHCVKEGIIPTR